MEKKKKQSKESESEETEEKCMHLNNCPFQNGNCGPNCEYYSEE